MAFVGNSPHHSQASGVLSVDNCSLDLVENGFCIIGSERVQEGFTRYQIRFQVRTGTGETTGAIKECEIWKRYSDFQQLAKLLDVVHSQFQPYNDPIPQLAKASFFGRFKDTVIEERRVSAEALLQFASRNPVLASSSPFRNFIQGAVIINTSPSTKSQLGNMSQDPSSKDLSSREPSSQKLSLQDPSLQESSSKLPISQDPTATLIEDMPVLPDTPKHSRPTAKPMNTLTVDSGWSNGHGQSDSLSSEGALAKINKVFSTSSPSVMSSIESSRPAIVAAHKSSLSSDSEEEIQQSPPGTIQHHLSRVGSVHVSQWGVEHTLKLKDEEGVTSSGREVFVHSSSTPSLVTQRKQVEPSQARQEEASVSWWSQALAETDVTDDFDTLIETIDKSSDTRPHPSFHPTSTSTDVERDSHTATLSLPAARDSSPSAQACPRQSSPEESSAYIVQAGKLISQGLQYESSKEYQEALDLFKAGVDVLLNGVQSDQNKNRLDMVRNKTAEYLQYAEQLQKKIERKSEAPATHSSSTPHLLPDFKLIQPLAEKVLLVQSKHTSQKFVFKVLYKSMTKQTPRSGQLPRSKNRSPSQCPYMVQLFHHYEVQARIFLLLEYVPGGLLVDHVNSLRHLHESSNRTEVPKEEEEDSLTKALDGLVVISAEPFCSSDEGSDIDAMLDELMTISPPTTRVGKKTKRSPKPMKEEEDSEEDSLAARRNMLLAIPSASEESQTTLTEPDNAVINVVPPTPTTPRQPMDLTSSHTELSPPIAKSSSPVMTTITSSRRSSGQSSPQFSPASLRNSPNLSQLMTEVAHQLEAAVQQWAAQIVVALDHLHSNNIVYQDLHPANILLTAKGDVRLTYVGCWDHVTRSIKQHLREQLYVAPELQGLKSATQAADWWSLGVVLFELLTGRTLIQCHPGGVHSHIPVTIPSPVSPEAQSLLRGLLQVNPMERLGCGLSGIEDLKSHPFFQAVDWNIISSRRQ